MYNPFEKGRWYRFFVESDSTHPTLTESDIADATITDTAIKIPNNYKAKEVVYDMALDGGNSTQLGLKAVNTGWNINLPDKTGYTDGYIYLFAERIL